MFSSKEQLEKRTPREQIDRSEYIGLLADEYYESTDLECKVQVTANLANFAYDPINFTHFKKSAVPDLFLDLLTDENHDVQLVLNGISGICNCCLDPEIRSHLLAKNVIDRVSNLLQHSNRRILIAALTTLQFVTEPSVHKAIFTTQTCAKVNELQKKHRSDLALYNLTELFLRTSQQNG